MFCFFTHLKGMGYKSREKNHASHYGFTKNGFIRIIQL